MTAHVRLLDLNVLPVELCTDMYYRWILPDQQATTMQSAQQSSNTAKNLSCVGLAIGIVICIIGVIILGIQIIGVEQIHVAIFSQLSAPNVHY